MPVEFADAIHARLAEILPGVAVTEAQSFYEQGGPRGDVLTYEVSYPGGGSGNRQLIAVDVDINIFTDGPDRSRADGIAAAVEDGLLHLWSVVTDRQGRVRLHDCQRANVPATDGKTAQITMRLSGRGFRRLGNG